MVPNSYQSDAGQQGTVERKPAWLAPAVVLVIVGILYLGSRKRQEVAENAVVDALVLTVVVLAFAHVLRWAATKLGSPGLARFFSLNYSSNGAQ